MYPKYIYDSGEGHAPSYRERKPQSWSAAYHSDYLKAFVVGAQSFPIWSQRRLHMDAWNNGFSITRTMPLTWRILNSVKLVYTISAEVWPSWAELTVDGSTIKYFDFRLGSGVIAEIIDITNLITAWQGKHEFVFNCHKTSLVGWGDYVVTVDIVLDGDFDPPIIPVWEQIIQWITDHPLETAGIGLAVAGVAIYAVKRRQKR